MWTDLPLSLSQTGLFNLNVAKEGKDERKESTWTLVFIFISKM